MNTLVASILLGAIVFSAEAKLGYDDDEEVTSFDPSKGKGTVPRSGPIVSGNGYGPGVWDPDDEEVTSFDPSKGRGTVPRSGPIVSGNGYGPGVWDPDDEEVTSFDPSKGKGTVPRSGPIVSGNGWGPGKLLERLLDIIEEDGGPRGRGRG